MRAALVQCWRMRTARVLTPRSVRYASNGPITLPMAFCMKRSFSASALSPVMSAPPTVSLWPPRYLVVECITMSMPCSSGRCSSGVAKVLSQTVMAPHALPSLATAGRSTSLSVGLVGVSTQIILGLWALMAASSLPRSVMSTNSTLSPMLRLRTRFSRRLVPP